VKKRSTRGPTKHDASRGAAVHQFIVRERIAEINSRAMKVLMKELGPGDFVRFMAQNFSGKRDYSRDRHKLNRNLTLDDIKAKLEQKK